MVSVPPPVVASAQLILAPLHAPERKSTTASNPGSPATVMVWFVADAVKEYQTSSSALPVNPPQVIPAMDWVAPTVVPDVTVQEAAGVRFMAPVQSSFVGGVATAIDVIFILFAEEFTTRM